jgi:hypothetical protein
MRKDEMGLDQQARLQWATPNACDGSKVSSVSTQGACLTRDAEASFLLAHPTETRGAESSKTVPISRRRLNAKFVEWLQGLPEGWTSADRISSEVLETWLSQSREHLGYLFSLIER